MKEEIIFGNYNGKELIWIPLTKQKNETLYILKEPLCQMHFTDNYARYENSEIRNFLLTDFFINSFSKSEKALLVPYSNKTTDLVRLTSHHMLKTVRRIINRDIFKEKHNWWLSHPVEAGVDDLVRVGVVGRFGFRGDIDKMHNAGVRPCIRFKEPPKF